MPKLFNFENVMEDNFCDVAYRLYKRSRNYLTNYLLNKVPH